MSSPYVPTTWVTGDVVTAAKANNWETQYADVFDSGAKTFAGGVTVSGTLTAAGVTATSLTATGGTVTVSTPIITGTETWNAAGVSFIGATLTFTETASASGSRYFQILGGASGATDAFYVSKGGDVHSGQDIISGRHVVSSLNVSAGTASALYWTSRSTMFAPSDGVILLQNQASTDFGRLQFGGTTSSFPAIKRNGAAIDVRLADDSGYANIRANVMNAVTGFQINGAATSGTVLLGNGTNYVASTLVLPNTATSTNALYASATNTIASNANVNFTSLGQAAFGSAITASDGFLLVVAATSGTSQMGLHIGNFTTTSAATTAINGVFVGISTAAASYTTALLTGYEFAGVAVGSGQTITRAVGYHTLDFSYGTNNALMALGDDTTFTGNWSIYQNSTKASYFNGGISAGTASDPGAGNMAANAFIPLSATVPTNGLFLAATNALGLATNSAEVARFRADGAFLIGTTTAALSAAGNVLVNGSLYVASMSSSTGTAVISNGIGGGYTTNSIQLLTSTARHKEHIEPWTVGPNAGSDGFRTFVSPEALRAFVRLAPRTWDYIGGEHGAASFISEHLAALPITNVYGRSPLVNYDEIGLPFSNRDHAIIALQHLVLQDHDARIAALEAAPGRSA
jgi:hypothetical protein